jgi:hypothetical protein
MKLRERILSRIELLLAETRRQRADSGIWRNYKLGEIDAEYLTDLVFNNVRRFVEALAQRPHHTAVLELPLLAENWPLDTGVYPVNTSPVTEHERACLLLSVMDSVDGSARWPAEIAPAEVAGALECADNDDAVTVAAALRAGRFFIAPDGHFSSANIVREKGELVFTELEEHVLSAARKWPPVGCAWVVLAEKHVRHAYAKHTTVPRSTALALSHVRTGFSSSTAAASVIVDPSGRTFATPASGTRYYRFKLPPKTQLSLPIECDPRDPFAAARETLSGMTLRVWLATWVLATDRSDESGLFIADLRRIIFDIFGMKPTFTTSKGKVYSRPSPRDEARVKAALEQLERIMLCGFGSFTLDKPEPVIRRNKVTDESTGREWEVYQHSPFAWAEARRNFVQIPTAALRLDANHSDLVLGIGNVLRARASRWLKSGGLVMKLEDFAREAGQPVDASVRREGQTYWNRLRERVSLVVTNGGFGNAKFGHGDGGEARLTIEPRDELEVVYRSLLEAIVRREQQAVAVAHEAEVRALIQTSKRGGRPRKPMGSA